MKKSCKLNKKINPTIQCYFCVAKRASFIERYKNIKIRIIYRLCTAGAKEYKTKKDKNMFKFTIRRTIYLSIRIK